MVPRGEWLTGVPGKGQQAKPWFPVLFGDQTLTGKTKNLRDLSGISRSFSMTQCYLRIPVTNLLIAVSGAL